MRSIILTKGQESLLDAEDYIKLSRFKWYAQQRSDGAGFYAARRCEGKLVYMHRFIMGARASEMVDHINGNTLDNRRENLRFCSSSTNAMNKKREFNNLSGFKGVSWDCSKNKWRAIIIKEGKKYYCGNYLDPRSAAEAYDKKAFELFGDFAKTNKSMGFYD